MIVQDYAQYVYKLTPTLANKFFANSMRIHKHIMDILHMECFLLVSFITRLMLPSRQNTCSRMNFNVVS